MERMHKVFNELLAWRADALEKQLADKHGAELQAASSKLSSCEEAIRNLMNVGQGFTTFEALAEELAKGLEEWGAARDEATRLARRINAASRAASLLHMPIEPAPEVPVAATPETKVDGTGK